ncbi:MAG: hypothetical protein ACMVY4_13185 [Minwuia sp.]|uniref:hypothetical protein n=1 Tax=Minwuia sp. TaxID=2493630 RepID=UPI003A89BBD2
MAEKSWKPGDHCHHSPFRDRQAETVGVEPGEFVADPVGGDDQPVGQKGRQIERFIIHVAISFN